MIFYEQIGNFIGSSYPLSMTRVTNIQQSITVTMLKWDTKTLNP